MFWAPAGTKAIYSDRSTLIETYENVKKRMGIIALPSLIITLALILLREYSNNNDWIPVVVWQVSTALYFVSFLVLICTGLPYIGYGFKLRRLQKY
ncbi:hypothetical protein GCM10009001_07560 [Virgibacillus siamensis]|uniref:Uncharacterized protein n=1 Tax=Virgibacillus siamensis TaxID=480071 RepID=A0ABN1FMH1_9BACI